MEIREGDFVPLVPPSKGDSFANPLSGKEKRAFEKGRKTFNLEGFSYEVKGDISTLVNRVTFLLCVDSIMCGSFLKFFTTPRNWYSKYQRAHSH